MPLVTKQIKHDRQQAKDKREADANADELARLEDIIDRGYQTFLEVGQALQEIRDQKLWKHEYDSFESYVEKKWKWTEHYAKRVIRAVKVAQDVGPPYPANEAVARALGKLPPEQRRAIWAALTSDNPDPTALEVRAFSRDPKPAAPPKPLEDQARKTIYYIKTVLAEFYPEPPLERKPGRPPREGWRADRRRQDYLRAIYHYVQEQMYFSYGAYRGKPKEKPPFEEPSAEHLGPTREELISAAIGDKG